MIKSVSINGPRLSRNAVSRKAAQWGRYEESISYGEPPDSLANAGGSKDGGSAEVSVSVARIVENGRFCFKWLGYQR